MYDLQCVASLKLTNMLHFTPFGKRGLIDGNTFNRAFNRAPYPSCSVQPSLGRSYSPLSEKEDDDAPKAEKDAPVPPPPEMSSVVQEEKHSEKGVPVPAPPEVPPVLQEQKESEKEVPAPSIGQEEIEEVGVGPKKQEMVAIKEEDKKEAVPEEEAVGAMEKTLPQVKEGAMEEEGK